MCADCCFNLAATLAAAALIIAGRQESWRGPHLVHRSLSPRHQGKSQQTAGEVWRKITVLTHQPGRRRRLLLLLGGGQSCVKKTEELGGRFGCIMPVWGAEGWRVCVCLSLCVFLYLCPFWTSLSWGSHPFGRSSFWSLCFRISVWGLCLPWKLGNRMALALHVCVCG